MCSFQRTLIKEATAKASGRAAGQMQTRAVWAEHHSPVATREWASGVLPAFFPGTRAPSAQPRYPRPHSCTIAVVSEAGLGSSCRTTGPKTSARKSTGGLDVEFWLVRTFPTPSSAWPPGLVSSLRCGPRTAVQAKQEHEPGQLRIRGRYDFTLVRNRPRSTNHRVTAQRTGLLEDH